MEKSGKSKNEPGTTPAIVGPKKPAHEASASAHGKRYGEAVKRLVVEQIESGKLTVAPSFRIGCIGAIDSDTMRAAVSAVGEVMCELGVAISSPLFGWIIDSWGFNAMYAVSVTLSVTLGTVYLVRSRHFVDDEQIQATTTDDNSLPVPTLSVSLSTTRDPDGDDELKSPVVVPRKSVDVSA